MASSDPAHFNPQVWNTQHGLHPLNVFWAQRFLVRQGYRNSSSTCSRNDIEGHEEPHELPQERLLRQESLSPQTSTVHADTPVKFTLNGLKGSWIPYGGGSRACPGRHFAKREILVTCAKLVAAFDIEVVTDEKAFTIQGGRYGLGAQKPARKVPVRIRRR